MTTATEHRPHAGHEHAHTDGCGHATVPHGDHVDYLHDGHAHHSHVTFLDASGISALVAAHALASRTRRTVLGDR